MTQEHPSSRQIIDAMAERLRLLDVDVAPWGDETRTILWQVYCAACGVDGASPLYSVTVMHPDVLFARSPHKQPHTVACCRSLEDAREIIEKNVFDVHESEYDYAVIELTSTDSLQGIGQRYPDLMHPERKQHQQWWYRWGGDRYAVCERPEAGLRVIAWAGF